MGWFQQVHAKSIGSQEIRALLVARKQLLGRLLDVELSIRGILRGFGLKVGQVTRKTFEARIRELVTGHTTLERIAATGSPVLALQPSRPVCTENSDSHVLVMQSAEERL
jgi:transposase